MCIFTAHIIVTFPKGDCDTNLKKFGLSTYTHIHTCVLNQNASSLTPFLPNVALYFKTLKAFEKMLINLEMIEVREKKNNGILRKRNIAP